MVNELHFYNLNSNLGTNIPLTAITSEVINDGELYYQVRNGVCYIIGWGVKFKTLGSALLISENMPQVKKFFSVPIFKDGDTTKKVANFFIGESGPKYLRCHVYEIDTPVYFTVSYLVNS